MPGVDPVVLLFTAGVELDAVDASNGLLNRK